MRLARSYRILVLIGLAVWGGSTGCTHNHYYGAAVPVCAEPAVVGGYGAVCEVPTQIGGGTVVAQAPAGPAIVANPPRSTRVVSSQPDSRPATVSTGRFAWRRSDPEGQSLATTRIEGALDDPISR